MGKCNYCHIEVTDNTEICPLCRQVLIKNTNRSTGYPNIIKKRKKLQLAARIYLFLAIVTEAVLIYLNARFYPQFKWSVIPGCLFACAYLTLYYLVNGTRKSYSMDIILGLIALVSIIDISDKLLGDLHWSVNYVQPGLVIAVNVLILIQIILRPHGWQSYIVSQLIVLIISLCAIPLVWAKEVTHPLVSVIAISTSVLFFVGTLIIGGSRSKEELYRRFHV